MDGAGRGSAPGGVRGARVGDAFMSLIYSAEMAGVDPFRYLVALQEHCLEVAQQPSAWMPWNHGSFPGLNINVGTPIGNMHLSVKIIQTLKFRCTPSAGGLTPTPILFRV